MTDASERFQATHQPNPEQSTAPTLREGKLSLQAQLGNLKVSQKIALSYALSLGLAILGTATGFLVGNYFHRQAAAPQKELAQELELLNQLQICLLKVRTHQTEFIALLDQPKALQAESSSPKSKQTTSQM